MITIIDNPNCHSTQLNADNIVLIAFEDLIKEGKITKEEILLKMHK